jgi:AraC-like DNA-binding protein
MYSHRSDSYVELTTGSVWWGALSLPIEDLTTAATALADRDIIPPRGNHLVVPSASGFCRLLALHSAVGELARHRSDVLAAPEVKRALEQTLVEAVMECFDGHLVRGQGVGHQRQALVMRRFHRVIEANPDRPLYVPEVCAAIKVSERTLRSVCQQHLGTSPKSYLQKARLTLAHRALCAAARSETSVTEIATRFGFWHFGRFAACYRAMFGETPSATLFKSSSRGIGHS